MTMNKSDSNLVPFAMIGAGFWAPYQLAAWGELPHAICVAVVDRDIKRAKALAANAGVQHFYDDIGKMCNDQQVRFVDIVSNVESHSSLIHAAAEQGADVICQKPLASSLSEAKEAAARCENAGVLLAVHENWRWQRPIRELKHVLDSQSIGKIFRARLNYNNSFPVFDNQPTLKEERRFILDDMGTHLLDVLRFLFGEPGRLYCETNRSREDIQGEDIASVLYRTQEDVTVFCSMSYASQLEDDRFPETLVLVEGSAGSVELCNDYWISLTSAGSTVRKRYPPLQYKWADPKYALVQSSMVPCQQHLLDSILKQRPAETSAEDNLKTLAMVEACYESASSGNAIDVGSIGNRA